MIRPLQAMGFHFELVLAESRYGERNVNCVNVLDELRLPYIVAIRSHHRLWLPEEEEVRQEPWQELKRTFSNGTTEVRSMAEVIDGKRQRKQYWLLTTAPETVPDHSTSLVMVCAPAVALMDIGNQYGFRTWIEYGLKPAKESLGWADFRMTSDEQIEKWWELVMSALFMVSLFADAFNDACPLAHQQVARHPWWNHQGGWKNLLNNLRLIIQPLMCFNWLKRWLEGVLIASLDAGFEQLMQQMNQFVCPRVHGLNLQLIFSSP